MLYFKKFSIRKYF